MYTVTPLVLTPWGVLLILSRVAKYIKLNQVTYKRVSRVFRITIKKGNFKKWIMKI